MMLGSFDINVFQQVNLPEEAQSIFDETAHLLLGVDMELMLYLGKQIVHGENHAYIVRSEYVVPDPKAYYELVIINANYESGERKTCIVRRETILKSSTFPDGGVVCSHSDEAPIRIINSIEANDLLRLFEKGMHKVLGLDYEAELYLGCRITKGGNYYYVAEAANMRDNTKSVKLVVINAFMDKVKVVEIKDILN